MNKSNNKIKILFVYRSWAPFVIKDLEILQKQFEVKPIKFDGLKSLFKIAFSAVQSDLTFAWFAGWHSAIPIFFSKLFRKKSIVVVGGYDAAYVPEMNYGAFTNLKEKLPVLYIYKKTDLILVVDLALKQDIIKNAKVKGDNIKYLPTGFDTDHWKSKGKKKNIALTVAVANDIKRVKLKGFDTFVKSAKYFPETKFIVVSVKGEARKYLEGISSKNVELFEFLSENDLLKCYQTAKVYCQLSFREGLPTSLCEAMLCECIPVGSNINGVKTAIGDTGFYADYGDEEATINMIKEALKSNEELGKKARERIKNLFPESRRIKDLEKLILDLIR